MGRINRSYLKDLLSNKKANKPKYQSGTEVKPTPYSKGTFKYYFDPEAKWWDPEYDLEKSKEIKEYKGPNKSYPLWESPTPLVSNDAEDLKRKIQTYKAQNAINSKFGTHIIPTGEWSEDFYDNFVQDDISGKPFIKPKSEDLRGYVPHYFPTLEEFKATYERIPKYNEGYESLYDSDQKNTGVQQGPLTSERAEELKNTPDESTLRSEYLGKTFGGLPVIPKEGFYEGYGPNRIWTSFANDKSQPFVGYAFNEDEHLGQPSDKKAINDFATNPLYSYFLLPKDTSNILSGPPDLRNYGHDAIHYNNDDQRFALWFPHDEESYIGLEQKDLLNSPETRKYIKDNNIDITAGSGKFGNPLAQSFLARRDAIRNKKDIGHAYTGGHFPIIQNPEAFTLAGYLPISADMYYADPKGRVRSYWDDPKKRKEYLKKAGVSEEVADKVYIHTSKFPIQEYKPRKDAQGNIYKKGGQVKSKLKTSYKNKRG